MDSFYDKLINSNEHLKNVLDIFVSIKNKKEYISSTDEKRILIKKISYLGFNTNIVGNSIIFAHKKLDKKISFEKSTSDFESLKITTEETGKIFILDHNYFDEYGIQLIDKKNDYHFDFWINKSIVDISLFRNRKNSKNESHILSRMVFDFIIENSAKKIEEVIDLTNLNFDVNLNKNKAIQILMSEIITIQKDIKEINVMKKNTTGLKING